MSRPRVLLILTEFPPRLGGMQTHAINLLQHLATRGYVGAVLTYQPSSGHKSGDWREVDSELPFPVHRILSRIGFWASVHRAEAFARTWKPDLVYCSTVFYGVLSSSLKVPILCRSVGNDVMRPWIAWPFKTFSNWLARPSLERALFNLYESWNCPEWIESLARRRRHEIMTDSARSMSKVFANSEFTAQLLRAAGVLDERIEVLVGGVDTAHFRRDRIDKLLIRGRLGVPENAWLMTTACRLVPKKGIDFLLQAFARLRQRLPDAHLMIVGSGPKASSLRRLANSHGLQHAVTFAGAVTHTAMPPYYWVSDVFVLASRVHTNRISGQQDAETMGRVLCEANAAGVPVMATRSGGIPSVIEHSVNGVLFEPDNIDDFVDAAMHLHENPADAEAMSQRGLAIAAANFDWAVVVDAHERSFAQALDAR